MQFLSFLLFTGAVAFVSWRFTRREDQSTSTGYFLAGRSLPWIVVAGSLLLTNLSTEQLVGLNGDAFSHGMQVMAWEVWSSIAIVLMALVFLPRYLRGGVATVSQFLARRYNRAVGLIISALLLLSLLTNLLPFVLYSGAVFMRDVFNVPEILGVSDKAALWVTVIALGTIGSIYAIFGGLKAVAVSDTLNGIGLLFGGLLIPILGLVALGDKLGDGGFGGGVSYLFENHPERLNPVDTSEKANIPFSTLFTGMLFIVTYYWCTNQAIVQRTFGSKSLAEGQKGVLATAFLKLFGPLYLVLPGIIAWHLFQDGAASGNSAYGALVDKVLPAPLLGLFAAVIFGAILSSFNSGLNSATTLFGIDFYKGLINPEASDAQTVRAGKFFGIAIAIGAILVAPIIDNFDSLFTAMKKLAALYNIPLLAVVVLGMFSKRVTSLAAIVGIAFGFLFYAIFGLALNNHILGIEMHWLHVAGINFVLVILVMLALTRAAPREEPYELVHTGDVDITPWPLALPVGICILVLIAVMYLTMSRIGV